MPRPITKKEATKIRREWKGRASVTKNEMLGYIIQYFIADDIWSYTLDKKWSAYLVQQESCRA
jgi:hypothetical protein